MRDRRATRLVVSGVGLALVCACIPGRPLTTVEPAALVGVTTGGAVVLLDDLFASEPQSDGEHIRGTLAADPNYQLWIDRDPAGVRLALAPVGAAPGENALVSDVAASMLDEAVARLSSHRAPAVTEPSPPPATDDAPRPPPEPAPTPAAPEPAPRGRRARHP